jgi:hypothetical protein
MAVSLTQSAYYTQNKLAKGIAELLIKESPILAKLPWVDVTGNALAVNMEDEDALGSVSFRAPNSTWTESTGNIEQVTYALKVLGEDADVDTFLRSTRSDVTDLMKTQIKIKTKLMGHAFENECVYGTDTSTNGFDGLHTWQATYTGQVVSMGTSATGAALTAVALDQAIDLVRAGRPNAIICNRNIRRRMTQYLRTVGSYNTNRDEYGNLWEYWQDIPILVSDAITQTETISANTYAAKTGGATSSIFVVYFSEGDGVCGIQNGGIKTEMFDKLETKDAQRCRIKWYCGLALYNPKAFAVIDGITDAVMANS